jgi:hypothetical protein
MSFLVTYAYLGSFEFQLSAPILDSGDSQLGSYRRRHDLCLLRTVAGLALTAFDSVCLQDVQKTVGDLLHKTDLSKFVL